MKRCLIVAYACQYEVQQEIPKTRKGLTFNYPHHRFLRQRLPVGTEEIYANFGASTIEIEN